MKLPHAPSRGLACLALIAGLAGGIAQAAQAAPALKVAPANPSFVCHWVLTPAYGWLWVCTHEIF